MKFEFTCEICKKEVKRGDHFSVQIWQKDDDISSTGEVVEDDVCKSCADRIVKKIDGMRKP